MVPIQLAPARSHLRTRLPWIPLAVLHPEIAARTITITSATNSFNIPALRCAVMHFGAPALKERFEKRIPSRLLGSSG